MWTHTQESSSSERLGRSIICEGIFWLATGYLQKKRTPFIPQIGSTPLKGTPPKKGSPIFGQRSPTGHPIDSPYWPAVMRRHRLGR